MIRNLKYLSLVSCLALCSSTSLAGLPSGGLQNLKDIDDPGFKRSAKAFAEAVNFSTRMLFTRPKTPGSLKYYFQFGGGALDVKDSILAPLMPQRSDNSRFSPDTFENVYFKAGLGLPFGLSVETGVSQVLSEYKLTGWYTNLAFQAFDLANVVYTDMVPSVVVTASSNFIVSGSSAYSLGGAILLGGYHRFWLAQVSYIAELSFVNLRAVSPSYNEIFIRHGLAFHWPLYEGVFMSANVFYRPIEANLSLGYQF
jgi:hypothetical protein